MIIEYEQTYPEDEIKKDIQENNSNIDDSMSIENDDEDSQPTKIPDDNAFMQDWMKYLMESLNEINQSNKILKYILNRLETKKLMTVTIDNDMQKDQPKIHNI